MTDEQEEELLKHMFGERAREAREQARKRLNKIAFDIGNDVEDRIQACHPGILFGLLIVEKTSNEAVFVGTAAMAVERSTSAEPEPERWVPVEERLPEANLLVQCRIEGLYKYDSPHTAIGYRSFPRISNGNVPIEEVPLVWFSGTRHDHKGRAESLHGVTHWAPMLDPREV